MSGSRARALAVVRDRLATAAAATKCHPCGCLRQTVHALGETTARAELAGALATAAAALAPTRYHCLGCAECHPAIAVNAFAEGFPDQAGGLDLCPTGAPRPRAGWPPLPGDYQVVRYRAPVAACTLDDAELARRLAAGAPEGLSIAGTLHTENLGIERLIVNVLANPNLRHLIVCGADARQAVGHLPGQSLISLVANGVDERGRIVGARGKRPVLVNVSADQVARFRRQVELISLIGDRDATRIAGAIAAAHARRRPPLAAEGPGAAAVEVVRAGEPRRLVPDPAGFFVIYPEPRAGTLIVEHYHDHGALGCVIEGATAPAVVAEIIARGLVTRLDHAAYLGRELGRAEHSLATGERYVQDRAAGEPEPGPPACGCGTPGGAPS